MKFAIRGLTVLAAATALVAGAAVSTASAAPSKASATHPTVAGKVATRAAAAVAHPVRAPQDPAGLFDRAASVTG